MRVILAVIAALALVSAIISGIGFFNVPSGDEDFRRVFGSGEGVRLYFLANGMVSFVIFVVAGSASAALDHLLKLRRDSATQTGLLEQIARQTAPPGSPAAKGASTVKYEIPGI